MAQDRFDTIVGANVHIKGNLTNQGSIEVHGNVEGEISSEEDIVIGQTATINGPIKAKNIDVSGTITGSVKALEKLELQSTCKVEGDITSEILSIKHGAIFNGTCSVTAGGSETKNHPPKKPSLEMEE